MLGLAFLVVR